MIDHAGGEGARVSALAGPGEVLVSSTVKDSVVGSSVEFEQRGKHELKGVPGHGLTFAEIGSMLWAAIAIDPRVGTQIRLITSPRFKGFVAIANREVLHALRQVGPKHQVDENFIAEIALGREVQTPAASGPPPLH